MAPQKIMVDYDKLPIRCRICLSWKHKASECKESMKRPKYVREKGRSAYPHNNQQMEKGKTTETNEDSFQQVKHRKTLEETSSTKILWILALLLLTYECRALA